MDAAFILGGGNGIRMGRLGRFLPKFSLVVYNQPLLARQLETCLKDGVQDVYLSIREQDVELVRTITNHYEGRLRIELLIDESPRGPVRAFVSALPQLAQHDTLFFLADIYTEAATFAGELAGCDPTHAVLYTYHEPDLRRMSACCNVVASGAVVREIIEKPAPERIDGTLCWTGITYLPAAYTSALLGYVNRCGSSGFSHIGELFQAALEEGLGVSQAPIEGEVCNITTPEDLAFASAVELRRVFRDEPTQLHEAWDKIGAVYASPGSRGAPSVTPP